MRTRVRRRVDRLLLAAAVLVAGGAALLGAAVGDVERVTGLWAAAAVGRDGDARVVEVIDYDFGAGRRHGIFRDVPGLRPDADVRVASTAPHQVQLAARPGETRIRIGDPARLVGGRQRYAVSYPLGGLVRGRRLAWDAVGTGWPVLVSGVRIEVVAPFAFADVACVQGAAGSRSPCPAGQPQPGRLVASVAHLQAGQGATLYATVARPLAAAPSLPGPPAGAPPDPGSGLPRPALVAAAAALLGAAPVSRLLRRAGRERVPVGGAAAAAWGGGDGAVRRVDADELAALATVEFVPPRELTAAEGGMVLAEAVRPEHRLAWLLGAAIAGAVRLEQQDGGLALVRLPRRDGATAATLDLAFAGRERVRLGAYDRDFAAAWQAIGRELAGWRQASGLWDPAGDRRRTLARLLGAVAAAAGLAAAAAGGALAARWGDRWLALAAAGGFAAGAGAAAALRAWELRVRTPRGAGLWLRVESFRRFLAASEARHAEEAARRGVLREYTAWAVAVGEVDRWSRAVAASAAAAAPGAAEALVAPRLAAAASAAAVAPSSGGGSGGGGVGGGAGGGGGGSW